MFEYRATLVRVVDADTIIVNIDLGFYTWLHDQWLRLYGIDAWEVRGPEAEQGKAAKAAVEGILATSDELVVRTHKDSKEKFGRWLAEVYVGGINLNAWLVAQGHAERVEY